MASQRKRFLSNDGSARSVRSNSPPDLLRIGDLNHHHFTHDSSSSDNHLNLKEIVGMDGSYNGTPTHSFSASASAVKVARRNSGGDNMNMNSNLNLNLQPRSLLQVPQRHHSGEAAIATGSSARRSPPLHSYSGGSCGGGGGGARQRQTVSVMSHPHSPFSSSNRGGGTGAGTTHNSSSSNSGSSRRSPKRSMTDYESRQQEAPSHSHQHHQPYGMLNPGPLKGNFSSNRWSSLSHAFHNFTGKGHNHHHQYGHYGNASNNKQLIAIFGFITLTLLGIAVYQHDAMLQEALQLKEQEVDHHILHAKELEKRLQAIRQHSIELEDKLEKSEGEPHIDLETQRKLFHLEHNQLKMQQDIQGMSKRLLKEKYGHGPRYYVQMKLEFDPKSNVYDEEEDGDEIIIETASINDMPHSIYLFLEQVDHHLYDHTSFHRNAAHLVQAGPSVNPNAHAHFRHQPSLNSVIFQEYAPEMTHKQYTLGYPGRPGGPDFYVNMRDNSAINGPGGQHTHYSDIILDADPCFAKIVKGWNAIERVHRSAVEIGNAGADVMTHPVLIANMKVLPPDYVVTHSDSTSDSDEDF